LPLLDYNKFKYEQKFNFLDNYAMIKLFYKSWDEIGIYFSTLYIEINFRDMDQTFF